MMMMMMIANFKSTYGIKVKRDFNRYFNKNKASAIKYGTPSLS